MKYLRRQPEGLTLDDRVGGTNRAVLHIALDMGEIELAILLVQSGARTYIHDNFGRTPLSLAIDLELYQLAADSIIKEINDIEGADLNKYVCQLLLNSQYTLAFKIVRHSDLKTILLSKMPNKVEVLFMIIHGEVETANGEIKKLIEMTEDDEEWRCVRSCLDTYIGCLKDILIVISRFPFEQLIKFFLRILPVVEVDSLLLQLVIRSYYNLATCLLDGVRTFSLTYAATEEGTNRTALYVALEAGQIELAYKLIIYGVPLFTQVTYGRTPKSLEMARALPMVSTAAVLEKISHMNQDQLMTYVSQLLLNAQFLPVSEIVSRCKKNTTYMRTKAGKAIPITIKLTKMPDTINAILAILQIKPVPQNVLDLLADSEIRYFDMKETNILYLLKTQNWDQLIEITKAIPLKLLLMDVPRPADITYELLTSSQAHNFDHVRDNPASFDIAIKANNLKLTELLAIEPNLPWIHFLQTPLGLAFGHKSWSLLPFLMHMYIVENYPIKVDVTIIRDLIANNQHDLAFFLTHESSLKLDWQTSLDLIDTKNNVLTQIQIRRLLSSANEHLTSIYGPEYYSRLIHELWMVWELFPKRSCLSRSHIIAIAYVLDNKPVDENPNEIEQYIIAKLLNSHTLLDFRKQNPKPTDKKQAEEEIHASFFQLILTSASRLMVSCAIPPLIHEIIIFFVKSERSHRSSLIHLAKLFISSDKQLSVTFEQWKKQPSIFSKDKTNSDEFLLPTNKFKNFFSSRSSKRELFFKTIFELCNEIDLSRPVRLER